MNSGSLFTEIPLSFTNTQAGGVAEGVLSERAYRYKDELSGAARVLWGIPFGAAAGDCSAAGDCAAVGDCVAAGDGAASKGGDGFILLNGGSASLDTGDMRARHIVFWHACAAPKQAPGADGIIAAFRGTPPLGDTICVYRIRYADGTGAEAPIRTRMEINDLEQPWGQSGFLCVPHIKGGSLYTVTDDTYAGRKPGSSWGHSQTRVNSAGGGGLHLSQCLYAWENPKPDVPVAGIEIEHRSGVLMLFGITAAHVEENPLRYSRRQKAALAIEACVCGDSAGGASGDSAGSGGKAAANDPMSLVDIDLGHIISVTPKPVYDNGAWEDGYNNLQPAVAENEYIVEFDAHPDATLYLGEKRAPLPVRELRRNPRLAVAAAELPVTLRVLDEGGKPVPVKVHAHGAAGEYLPPRHRHRLPNPYWFEDYSVDFVHGPHWCTYIEGEADYLLPPGEVFIEVSKGFEIKPLRRRFDITPDTTEIVIRLERVLDWRSRGWVTADTHVHFLSPDSALLEGAAEGVNVVNLLASQWGELFTNIGDFTGSGETGGGEYMVRVGTENRQQVLGHISLIGYDGRMILPLTTGGPDESALGDPVETTLTRWAAQSRAQGGISVLPHFPNPRAEAAAAIVSELIDGVEMTSWGDHYSGINPYSLSDWYRYLNCGYHLPAVGGTDKMSANTAVGTVRTYAKLDGPFTYKAWMDAVRAGRTFATYGALAELRVEDRRGFAEAGGTVALDGDATLNVAWSVASATIPVTAVELVMNGETVECARLDALLGSRDGAFAVRTRGSCWLALRIRGHQPGKPEIIIAHTSAVMVTVNGQRPINAPDAATILDQIEGATAFIKTLGTRAQEKQFKLALAELTAAHRALHNRMHEMGQYHHHITEDKHPGH